MSTVSIAPCSWAIFCSSVMASTSFSARSRGGSDASRQACVVTRGSSQVVRELVGEPARDALARAGRWFAALRAGDVGLEQLLAHACRGLRAPGDHHELRVAVQRPRVEVDGA